MSTPARRVLTRWLEWVLPDQQPEYDLIEVEKLAYSFYPVAMLNVVDEFAPRASETSKIFHSFNKYYYQIFKNKYGKRPDYRQFPDPKWTACTTHLYSGLTEYLTQDISRDQLQDLVELAQTHPQEVFNDSFEALDKVAMDKRHYGYWRSILNGAIQREKVEDRRMQQIYDAPVKKIKQEQTLILDPDQVQDELDEWKIKKDELRILRRDI